MRDLTRMLSRHGLAIAALPSHNAQSVGGILSTDVHGALRRGIQSRRIRLYSAVFTISFRLGTRCRARLRLG